MLNFLPFSFPHFPAKVDCPQQEPLMRQLVYIDGNVKPFIIADGSIDRPFNNIQQFFGAQ
jgi:hypothetical protein